MPYGESRLGSLTADLVRRVPACSPVLDGCSTMAGVTVRARTLWWRRFAGPVGRGHSGPISEEQQAMAATADSVSMTFAEPIVPAAHKDCAVQPDGFAEAVRFSGTLKLAA